MGRRPIAAVAVVLTATVAGFLGAREISERDVQRDGTHRADIAAAQVRGRLNQGTDLVRSIKGFLVGHVTVGVDNPQFMNIGERWLKPGGFPAGAWVERAGASGLRATLVTGVTPMTSPGIDLAGEPDIGAAVANPRTRDAVTATRLARRRDGSTGLFLVESAPLRTGSTRAPGYAVLFVPARLLLDAATERGRAIPDLRLTAGGGSAGGVGGAATSTSRFTALGQQFEVRVPRRSVQGAEAVLPWAILGAGVVLAVLAGWLSVNAARRAAAQRELDRFFSISPDAMTVVGSDGHLRRVNPSYAGEMGYSEDELLARPMVEFVHPDDRGKAASAIGMIAERGTATFEVRNVRKDGSDMWIEWTVTASPENNLTYAVGRDVTERREAEERYRLLAEEQAALRRVATLVARPGSPSEVFELVAKEVHRLLGADSAVLLQYEPEDTMTVVAVTGGLAGGLPLGTSVTLDGDGLNGIRSAVRAPIVVRGRRWGIVIAGWTHAERLADDIESRVGQFTELVATAIANADTYAQLTASRARVVATADETRRRIERDLHDGAQQRLVHTLVSLKLARRGMAETPERAADLVDEALEHAELANSELRDLAHGILPGALKAGGLRPAVEALVSRVRLPVSVDVTPERLPPALEATAYFIIAEALTNTVKHAEASSAQVTAVVDDGVLRIEARDDGVGGARTDGGTGLVGLRDRASALDGELAVRSAPGGGTVVTATLPIPAAAAAG